MLLFVTELIHEHVHPRCRGLHPPKHHHRHIPLLKAIVLSHCPWNLRFLRWTSLLLAQLPRHLLSWFIDHKMIPSVISVTTRTTHVQWILQMSTSRRRLALKEKIMVRYPQVNPGTRASSIKNLRSPLKVKKHPMPFTETLRHKTRPLYHPHHNLLPSHPLLPFLVHGLDSSCLRHQVICSLHQHRRTRRNTMMFNNRMTS
jgi:hypothetical protein